MKLTYAEVKQQLGEAKKERLFEIVDQFNKKEEILEFACKLSLGRTDIENIKMTSLKDALYKIKVDFKEDRAITNFLETTMEAINDYQKQLWKHQKQEGKEEVIYQTASNKMDSFESDISKGLEDFSEKVVANATKEEQARYASERSQQEYMKALTQLKVDLKKLEGQLQYYLEKQADTKSDKLQKIYEELQEELEQYQSRNTELKKMYNGIIKEGKDLKIDLTSFEKEVQQSFQSIQYELPRVEHLLDGLTSKLENSLNDKKKEKGAIRAKRALQDALDRYEIKMQVLESHLKELDKSLEEYSKLSSLEEAKTMGITIENLFREIDTRFQTVEANLDEIVKCYQKLGIDSSDYQKKEQEKLQKYHKIHSMLQEEYHNAKTHIQKPEKKVADTKKEDDKTASQTKREGSDQKLKEELSKELDKYAELIEKFETDLDEFSDILQTYKEKIHTYTAKNLANIRKRLQSAFQGYKLQLFGLDKKYHEILNRFKNLELDTKEFELQNAETMTPIKKKFTKVEKECNDFGVDVTHKVAQENQEQPDMNNHEESENQKELTKTQLYCKETTLTTLIERASADVTDFQLTLDFYKEKMESCNPEKCEKIKEKLQKLYNHYQLEMSDLHQKYLEVYKEYAKKGLSMEALEEYKMDIEEIYRDFEKIEDLCAELGLDPNQITPETIEQREAKKKDLANMKSYLLSLKKLAPWALGGAVVGLGASVVIPSVTIAGLGSIRIAYSLAKFGNKIISTKFLNGEPTPIDNAIDYGKTIVKNFGNRHFGEKKGYRKIREGVRNINNFLKNPKVQSVITGLSIGYVAGNIMNLNEKVDKLFQNSQPQPEGGAVTSNLRETIETETKKVFEQPEVPASPVETPEVPSYEWIKTGETIDLTGIEEGYTNVYDAMANNNAVSLINELASQENGTFIEQFVLPNGEKFFGNMDALIEKCEELGVKLENVGALISNQNGYYGYTTGEEIIEHALEMSKSL